MERDVQVTLLDGQAVQGELLRAAPALVLKIADEERSFAWTDVLSLAPGPPAPASRPTSAAAASRPADAPLRFTLLDGTSLLGKLETAGEREWMLRVLDDQPLRLAADQVRSIVTARPPEAALGELAGVLTASNPTEDVAIVAREARVVVLRGAIRGVSAAGATFRWNNRDVALPWERTVALVFAREEQRPVGCVVRLAGGDVLAGRVVGGDGERIAVRSSAIEKLSVPLERIERIDCRSGKLDFLSDAQPIAYEFKPLFQKRWEYGLDRSLSGQPIRLSGRDYPKGVVLRSQSALTWRLGGGFKQFAATVGILDETAGRGNADVRVVGDGRVLWSATALRGGAPPADVLVDVTGVDELALEVDFGDDLDSGDHVGWALARVIR